MRNDVGVSPICMALYRALMKLHRTSQTTTHTSSFWATNFTFGIYPVPRARVATS